MQRKSCRWRPFEEAREIARSLGLKTMKEYFAWCKTEARPKDMPLQTYVKYRGKGWIGYGDWLGTGRPALKGKVSRKIKITLDR
jgi:hypothetical protein